MDLANKKINFLGDSITEGYGATNHYGYVDYIAENTKAICRNYGIAGTRIAIQRTPSEIPNFDKYFLSRLNDMDSDADFILIFGGTNDYGHGDATFGKFNDRTPDTFYGALHNLYQTIIEKFVSSEIIILTPLHRIAETDNNKNSGLPLLAYVNAIREVAEYYSLPVIDLYKSSGIQPNVVVNREKYTFDGLHPNDIGHKRIADIIIKYLENNY